MGYVIGLLSIAYITVIYLIMLAGAVALCEKAYRGVRWLFQRVA